MTPGTSTYHDDMPAGITPAVQWLLVANIVVYFIQLTVLGTDNMVSWFALSSAQFPEQWWGLGTYMFVHGGFMHLTLNMLMLWMFGRRVEMVFGTRAFVNFYLWCGLGGAVFHLLFVRNGAVVGASGAVVGVVLAYALRWPDDELYLFGVFPVKARWLAIGTIAWNVAMALSDLTTGGVSSGTAWMAHVGGLAFAWLYLRAPMSDGLDRIRQRVSMAPDDENYPKAVPRKSPRSRKPHGRPQSADEAVARSNALFKHDTEQVPTISVQSTRKRLEQVNALLDKISRDGMESLTPAERRLLEEMSRGL